MFKHHPLPSYGGGGSVRFSDTFWHALYLNSNIDACNNARSVCSARIRSVRDGEVRLRSLSITLTGQT